MKIRYKPYSTLTDDDKWLLFFNSNPNKPLNNAQIYGFDWGAPLLIEHEHKKSNVILVNDLLSDD